LPEVVPFAVSPDGDCQKFAQPARPPRIAIRMTAPSSDRPFRRDGIPSRTMKASAAPPPAPIHPRLPFPGRARGVVVEVAAVVVIVAVTVPLVDVELKATVVGDKAQAGKSTAPDGEDVNAQVSVAVPV
jgi:hypothetical protein